MRKISKSRNEDETISSTNGSVTNDVEDQPESEQQAEKKDAEFLPEANENGGNEDAELSDDDADKDKPAKKRKSRSKSKGKKKSGKKAKDDADEGEEEEEEEEYEVEKIIDSKKIKGKLHYLIRWKGYGADSDTWEPENTVSCPNLVTKFNEEQKKNKKEVTASPKKSSKRKGKPSKEPKTPAKKPKNEWDSENADKNEEYEVDRILEVHHKKNGKREFLIHWKGWSNKFDSWEPESHLNCKDLIKKFMEKVESARSTESRSLRVAPETTNRFTLQAPSSGRRLSKRRGQSQRVRYDDAE